MADENIDEKKELELRLKAEQLKQYLSALKQELNSIAQFVGEMLKVKAILENKKSDSFLSPIGMGFFIPAKLEEDSVFLPIGGGYYVKISREKAIEIIEESLKEVKERQAHLAEEIKKAEEETISLLRKAR